MQPQPAADVLPGTRGYRRLFPTQSASSLSSAAHPLGDPKHLVLWGPTITHRLNVSICRFRSAAAAAAPSTVRGDRPSFYSLWHWGPQSAARYFVSGVRGVKFRGLRLGHREIYVLMKYGLSSNSYLHLRSHGSSASSFQLKNVHLRKLHETFRFAEQPASLGSTCCVCGARR